jgi:hypothetical protein
MLADWREAQRAQLLVIVAAGLIIGLLTALSAARGAHARPRRGRNRKEEPVLKLLTENLRAQAMLDGMTGIPTGATWMNSCNWPCRTPAAARAPCRW